MRIILTRILTDLARGKVRRNMYAGDLVINKGVVISSHWLINQVPCLAYCL